jgi:hypothetical protein
MRRRVVVPAPHPYGFHAIVWPARRRVQAARETARRLQFQNNLRRLSLGCLTYEQAPGFLPGDGNVPLVARTDCDRSIVAIPRQDTPGYSGDGSEYGSAHSVGFQMAFCGGSVQMIGYLVDPAIHANLGNRCDGALIDRKKF